MLICQPSARLLEILVQIVHHEINRSTTCPAHEASVHVLPHTKRQARMVVRMKRTQALMSRNLEPKSLCDPLNGEVAEPLKFYSIHNCQLSIINYEGTRRFWCTVPSGMSR